MENDALKSAWQAIPTPRKSDAELKSALREGVHPVLKGIRRQLVIEAVAFAVFLSVYYDFFDGDRKPLYANIMLVGAMLFVIAHNIAGYLFARQRVGADSIRQSLEGRLARMKAYAAASIAARVLAGACLCLFFTSVIEFDASRYGLLAVVITVFAVQVAALSGLWRRRIRRMQEVIEGF